jgi:hypothetical protein
MRKNVLDKDRLCSEHYIGDDAILVAAYVDNDIAVDTVHCVD